MGELLLAAGIGAVLSLIVIGLISLYVEQFGGFGGEVADQIRLDSRRITVEIAVNVAREALGFVPILGSILQAYDVANDLKMIFEILGSNNEAISAEERALAFVVFLLILFTVILPGARRIRSLIRNEAEGAIRLAFVGYNKNTSAGRIRREAAALVKPEDGYYDMFFHGNPTAVEGYFPRAKGGYPLDTSEVVEILSKLDDYPSGTPIRLVACSTGKLENGFAAKLAKKAGVPVKAPKMDVYIGEAGGRFEGKVLKKVNGGFVELVESDWNIFYP